MTEPPRREKLSVAVKIAAGMALFQAIFAGAMVAALALGLDVRGFNLFSLLDVIVLTGLAIAVFNRRLWAAYTLAGYGLLEFIVKAGFIPMAVPLGGIPWAVPLLVYVAGAFVLQASPNRIAPSLAELNWVIAIVSAVVWVAGNFVIGFLFGLFGFIKGGVPINTTTALVQMVLYIVWGVLVSYSVARRSVWPFETILLVALISIPLGTFDLLTVHLTPIDFVIRVIWFLAVGVIGFGLASLTSRPVQLAPGWTPGSAVLCRTVMIGSPAAPPARNSANFSRGSTARPRRSGPSSSAAAVADALSTRRVAAAARDSPAPIRGACEQSFLGSHEDSEPSDHDRPTSGSVRRMQINRDG